MLLSVVAACCSAILCEFFGQNIYFISEFFRKRGTNLINRFVHCNDYNENRTHSFRVLNGPWGTTNAHPGRESVIASFIALWICEPHLALNP